MLPKSKELIPLGGRGGVMWIYTAISANGIAKVRVCEGHYLGFYFLFLPVKNEEDGNPMEIVEERKRIAVRMKMIR